MSNSGNTKSIRFHINSKTIAGSFVLTFDYYIATKIEDEIDSFIYSAQKKIKDDKLSIQKSNSSYEINLNAFPAIFVIIFKVLRNYE